MIMSARTASMLATLFVISILAVLGLACASSPTPTPMPTATATPDPISTWQGTGYWYRDSEREKGILDVMEAVQPGGEYGAKVATVDADPTHRWSALGLSLICVSESPGAWTPAGYLIPYSLAVPDEATTYSIGIWDGPNSKWIEDIPERQVQTTEDGHAVVIYSRAILRQVVSMLARSEQGLPEGQVMFAGIRVRGGDVNEGNDLMSTFDAAGLEDALDYIGCLK